jgi:MoxR-like ATPase
MMRLRIGYPDSDYEKLILRHRKLESPVEQITPVMHGDDVLVLQREVRDVLVDEALIDYLVRIVRATRDAEILDLGVSPRGSLALYHAAQALAYVTGRNYVIPDDIKRLVVPVFAHRIVVSSRYSTGLRRSEESEAALHEIIKTVSVPL